MYTEEHIRQAEQYAADLQWSERERRRDNRRMLAGIVVSVVIALPVMLSSARVTSEEIGRVLLWGGLAIGQIGVFGSVLWGLYKAVQRGDTRW